MVQFVDLLRRLVEARIEFIVVGGVAAALHGAARPTKDLDVCIRLSAEQWQKVHRLIAPLHPRHALTPDRRPITDTAHELATCRNLYVLTDLGRVDFLGEVPPLGDIDHIPAMTVEVEDFQVRVIGIDALIGVKEHIRRASDLETAKALRALREGPPKR